MLGVSPDVRLEDFLDDDSWKAKAENNEPVAGVEANNREDTAGDRDLEGEKVDKHGADDSANEVHVLPWWHDEDGLPLRDGGHGREHFDNNKNCHGHGGWGIILEDVVELRWSGHPGDDLLEGNVWTAVIEHVPPVGGGDCGETEVSTTNAVAGKGEWGDNALVLGTWRHVHNAWLSWVDTESGSWKTVGDKVDEEELGGTKEVRATDDGGDEAGNDFTDVAGKEVADEGGRVVVDGTALSDSLDNGGEGVIGKDHLGSILSDLGTSSHGDTDIGSLKSWSIVDTITSHGDDVALGLEDLDELLLVEWLDTGENASGLGGLLTLLLGHVGPLVASEDLALRVSIGVDHADLLSDGGGSVGVITSAHDDTDTGTVALFD